MERSISIIFCIDLESIQHKLSSEYSLHVSGAVFLILMVHHFLRISPLEMSVFERSVTGSYFPEIVFTY